MGRHDSALHQPKRQDFEHYVGRGISACDRWRNSFAAFLAGRGSSA